MKIRTKTLVVVGATALVLSLVLGVTMYAFISSSYADMENQNVATNVNRVLRQIEQEETNLLSVSYDWSQWNDTYQFVTDVNQGYIDANLQYTTLSKIRVNFMMFYNTSGALVYTVAYDFHLKNQTRLPESVYRYFRDHPEALLPEDAEDFHLSGIIYIGDHHLALMISMTPIVQRDGQGPSRGVIVVGKILDDMEIRSLENITNLDVRLLPMTPQVLDGFQQTSLASNGQPLYVKPVNNSYIFGCCTEDDVVGLPSFVVEVGSSRLIHSQGTLVIRNLVFSMLIILLVFIGLIVFLFDRFVTSRLTSLTHSIDDIKNSRDLSKKLYVKGDDEIATLEQSFDTMMTSLQDAWTSRDVTEVFLKKKIEELERFKAVTVDREIRMKELKKQLEELRDEPGRPLP